MLSNSMGCYSGQGLWGISNLYVCYIFSFSCEEKGMSLLAKISWETPERNTIISMIDGVGYLALF